MEIVTCYAYCMKSISKVLFFLLFLGVFVSFVTDPIHAALVPCGMGDGVSGGFLEDECNFCDLQVLALNILNFLVLISAVVAALLFLNAGFLYITSSANPGNISKAHKIFGNTLVGMIVIFASWLIINQIMVILYNGSPLQSMGDWNAILDGCQNASGPTNPTNPPSTDPPSTDPPSTDPPSTDPPSTDPPADGTLSEADARSQVDPYFNVWESSPGATTFEGVQQSTIDGAIAIAEDSGIPKSELWITGAVDPGAHNPGEISHGTGYKLDFEDTVSVNNYFESSGQFVRDGSVDGYPRYTGTINGQQIVAVYENRTNTHWDVTFY